MRKYNSSFKTAFLSEVGSRLENNDYFGFVELDGYACYVVADGITHMRGSESARTAIEAAINAFQEDPGISRRKLGGYLRSVNRELSNAKGYERLKASVTVVVTDYQKCRYGYAGNIRFRLYRNGRLEKVTYPDGRQTGYEYDSMGQIWRRTDSTGYSVSCLYSSMGRIQKVAESDGQEKAYTYDMAGHVASVTDALGNKTEYAYTPGGRLREVLDALGNRTEYTYDMAGRLTRVCQYGDLEADRITEYVRNSFGQRTAEEKEGIREEYLLDLTQQYNNMLWLERNKKKQRFYWDSNVSVMEEEGRKPQYYLQDEMGSVLRILYDNGNGDRYGYDEFGRDAHVLEQEVKTEPSYTRQGAGQPFGYTGYRYDGVTGAYFAQAREYRPESGRFLAEDLVRGSAMAPKTWNRYGYCWNNPTGFVDLNGKTPELPTLQLPTTGSENIAPDLFKLPGMETEVETLMPDLSPYMPDKPINKDKPKEKFTIPSWVPPYDSGKEPFKVSVEFGTGLYASGKAGAIEGTVGFKDYVEFNSQNLCYFLWGVEAGVGVESEVASLEAGGEYVCCPLLDDRVMKEGFFLDADLFHFMEEDGDIYFRLGAELYVAIGGGFEIELNISECLRRMFPINKD